jgi:ABC-2 type transport system ATP-binding protein
MPAAIAMRGLTKRYGATHALVDLTLEVPHGSIFGFLGPNGAGKSTTLKVLAGLARPTAGAAAVNGVPVTSEGLHRRELGYLAQSPRFYDWMTGRETLRYAAALYGTMTGQDARIDELLERVGIAGAADRRTETYSGGMRQRLGIAAALVGRPSVVVLDEPVSALDPIGRRDILDLMRSLKGETTVFYSTHILDDVERVSDHVAIVDHGRLVTTAPTKELLSSFGRGRLAVVVVGDAAALPERLGRIEGITSIDVEGRDGDTWRFTVDTARDGVARVQREITRAAAAADLTLISSAEEALDLESVFLRLVDTKEVAA